MARDDSAQVRTEVMDTPRTLWRLGFYPARRRLGGATTEHSMGMIEKEVYTLIIKYLQVYLGSGHSVLGWGKIYPNQAHGERT